MYRLLIYMGKITVITKCTLKFRFMCERDRTLSSKVWVNMLLLTEIFSQLVSCHGDQTEIACFT